MAGNKRKTEELHDQLPELFNSRNNVNWKALVEAIGGGDQETEELIEAVRQQFFIKTAQRPFLDRLGANVNVGRPRFVGMDDPTFRRFIPVMSYQPKQVKLILDTLLDIFFFKDATTAFLESIEFENFTLQDGWELEVLVDEFAVELITFENADFGDISNATADEVVAAINRQAKEFYAVKFEDSVRKRTFIRLFTRTVGSKGSLEITGGRANVALKFDGSFNFDAGNGNNTEWTVNKIGDEVNFQFTGGNNPLVENVEEGDYIIIDLPGNEGSFKVTEVDVSTKTIKFINLFGTEGVFTQSNENQVKFLKDFKSSPHKRRRRAITWEIQSGEIIVEMPTSPPVVKRNRKGAAHINGFDNLMVNRISDTELELDDASEWPEDGGRFFLEEVQLIKSNHETPLESSIIDHTFKTRVISDQPTYTYTGKTGNILTGISPALPPLGKVIKSNINTVVRTSNLLTVTTDTPHEYVEGQGIHIQDASVTMGMTDHSPNGQFIVKEVLSPTQFTADSFGDDGTATGGFTKAEKIGLNNFGSKVIFASSKLAPDKPGPYVWDSAAAFVLSSLTTNLTSEIRAGNTERAIEVNPNDILDEEGRLIFDFGTENQEGPIRYFFKPNSTTIAIDPSYVFQKNHDVGSSVTMIRRTGAHVLSGTGDEFPPYITDPSAAREILQDLMRQVKSVGIFLNFLIRFPEQVYATLDVYNSGVDPDDVYREQLTSQE